MDRLTQTPTPMHSSPNTNRHESGQRRLLDYCQKHNVGKKLLSDAIHTARTEPHYPLQTQLSDYVITLRTLKQLGRSKKELRHTLIQMVGEIEATLIKSLEAEVWTSESIDTVLDLLGVPDSTNQNKVRLKVKDGKVLWWVYSSETRQWYKPSPCKQGRQHCTPIRKEQINCEDTVEMSIENFLLFKNAGKRNALAENKDPRQKRTLVGNRYIDRHRRHRNEVDPKTGRAIHTHSNDNMHPNITRTFDVGSYETLTKYKTRSPKEKKANVQTAINRLKKNKSTDTTLIEELEQQLIDLGKSLEMDHVVQDAAWRYWPKTSITINKERLSYDAAKRYLKTLKEAMSLIACINKEKDPDTLWKKLKSKSNYSEENHPFRRAVFSEYGLSSLVECLESNKTDGFPQFQRHVSKYTERQIEDCLSKIKKDIKKTGILISQHSESMKSTGLAIALPPETHRKGRTHQYNNGTDALKAFKRMYKSNPKKAFVAAFSADIEHYLTLKEDRFNLYRVGAFRYLYKRCVALHGTDPEFTIQLDKVFMTVLKRNSLL